MRIFKIFRIFFLALAMSCLMVALIVRYENHDLYYELIGFSFRFGSVWAALQAAVIYTKWRRSKKEWTNYGKQQVAWWGHRPAQHTADTGMIAKANRGLLREK